MQLQTDRRQPLRERARTSPAQRITVSSQYRSNVTAGNLRASHMSNGWYMNRFANTGEIADLAGFCDPEHCSKNARMSGSSQSTV